MLLLYVTVSCVLLGSSAAFMMTECYGGSVGLTLLAQPYFTGQLYFTPNGGNKKLVMDNGKAKDPRLKITDDSVEYTDLTESGVFSISGEGDVITVTVEDCADKVSKSYGEIFSFDVPGQAEFTEFTTRRSEGRPQVLWKRTDPQTSRGGRGQVRRNVWEMKTLTYKDSGHYNFRAKDNRLLSRKLLQVEVPSLNYNERENMPLFIPYPLGSTLWSVNFNGEPLVKDGDLVTEDHKDSETLVRRTRVRPGGILIDPVKVTDSGIFTFIDREGSVAQRATLVVEPEPTSTSISTVPVYLIPCIAGGIILMLIVCCCCVMKGRLHPSNSAGRLPVHHHPPINSLASHQAATAAVHWVHRPVHARPWQPGRGLRSHQFHH